MSIAASAKAKLVGTGNVLADVVPAGVVVAYSLPGTIPRELVYGGRVTGPVTLAAMAGGGRVKRSEELVLELYVRVAKPNTTAEAVEARAVEIGTAIGEYIAANWTLGGLPGLIKATVDGVDLGEPWTDDDGAGTVLTLAVGLKSYLT